MIALGSIARNDHKPYSDIDLALVVHESTNENVVCSEIKNIFKKDMNFNLKFSNPAKLVLYLGNDLVKLDLFIIKAFTEIEQYFWDLATPTLENAILFDQTGDLTRLLNSVQLPADIDIKSEIHKQIRMFLYSFEAFSNAHRISDGYRSYFEYNLALHRLVRIVYLLRGGKNFLFLPRNFVQDYLKKEEQKVFRHLNGQIYLRAINETKKHLLTFFHAILDEIETKFSSLIDREEIKEFCETIFQRDYFWNLRDIAKITPQTVQENRIYRSSTLFKYVSNQYFEDWIRKRGIKTIIDLQTKGELKQRFYPEEFLKEFNYYNIPLFPIVGDDKGDIRQSKDKNSILTSYQWALKHRGEQIKEIFEILAHTDNYPLIIHCYAGKDRTGIIVALLHLLLGTPKELILEDYLTSSVNTLTEDIESVFSYIEFMGGIKKFLENIGIKKQIQTDITKILRQFNQFNQSIFS